MGARSHLSDNFTSSDSRAQLLVHSHGILCKVPQPDSFEEHLARRLPRRVWTRDPGDVFIIMSPWCWLLVPTIFVAWPGTEVGAVENLNAPRVAEGRAA